MATTLKDISGQKFGHWQVLERGPNYPSKGSFKCVRYWCICDCGLRKLVRAVALRLGKTSQCLRCSQRSMGPKLSRKGTAMRKVLSWYKAGAQERGIKWCLTVEQFVLLTSSPCYYTGRIPSSVSKSYAGEIYLYNGIDRLDSDGNYTMENCVPCCSEVNKMKMDMPLDKFLQCVREVYKKHG